MVRSSTTTVASFVATLFLWTVSALFGRAKAFSVLGVDTARRADATSSSLRSSSSSSSLTHAEIARYSRHLVLGEVGVVGQERLKRGRVLVVGAGGLGSPCLLYLAAAGVGRIGVVDGDVVDESNLQRQIVHATSTVGESKCASAAARLRDVNPFVEVRTYEEELTSDNALRVLADGWDVVVDGSDNFPTKYLINDACAIAGVPWVYSAILAFEGQLSVFNRPPGVGPDYRDMMPEPPPPGDVPSCAEGGVLGVLPGTMGCLQATEVLKLLLGRDDDGVLSGTVLRFDALRMEFSKHGLRRRPDDDRDDITELIDYQGFCRGETTTTTTSSDGGGGRTMDEVETLHDDDVVVDAFRSLPPVDCLDRLKDGWTPYVLDVRLRTEHDIVALPFTDAVTPHRTVSPADVPREGDVLVYCKAGVRGAKACRSLVAQGVDADRLWNLEGGVSRWRVDVDPAMPRY